MTQPRRDPVELTIELMRVDSTTGREGEVIALVERLLRADDWCVTRIPVSAGRDDLLATSDPAPMITLSTHLDTVPPYIPPRLDGDVLRGRGSCDAKGIAAAMWCAAERLRARGIAVALLFVVGEEVSHDGAHAANLVETTSRVLIGGEPTDSTLALGTKGALRATVRVHGIAGHSAYPELGRSAIDELVSMLHDLRAHPLPSDPVLGETTINVGLIHGGAADNVIAPSAEARLVVRLVGAAAEMRAILESWAAGRAELEITAAVPAMRLGALDGFPTSIVAYATDVPVLSRWGTPYLFGPGTIHVAHGEHEHVRTAELVSAVDAYERLAVAALRKEGVVAGERAR